MEYEALKRAAVNIRVVATKMVETAGAGNLADVMSGAEFLSVLYFKHLVEDPDNRRWRLRDRFFFSPNRKLPLLYSALYVTGNLYADEAKQICKGEINGESDVSHGIEFYPHSPGDGLVAAVECAMARIGEQMTYAFVSDDDLQAGCSQEAARKAGDSRLGNLVVYCDCGTDGGKEDVVHAYRAMNWNVVEVDSTDVSAIDAVLDAAKNEKECPTLVIGYATGVGEGIAADALLGKSQPDYAATIETLGGSVANPWAVFPEVSQLCRDRKYRLRQLIRKRK